MNKSQYGYWSRPVAEELAASKLIENRHRRIEQRGSSTLKKVTLGYARATGDMKIEVDFSRVDIPLAGEDSCSSTTFNLPCGDAAFIWMEIDRLGTTKIGFTPFKSRVAASRDSGTKAGMSPSDKAREEANTKHWDEGAQSVDGIRVQD